MNAFIPCVPSRIYSENWNVSQLLGGQSWQSSFIIAKRNNDSDVYTYLLWAQAAKNNTYTNVLLFESNWSCSDICVLSRSDIFHQSLSCSFTRHSVKNETLYICIWYFYKPIIWNLLSAFRISLLWRSSHYQTSW